jgi:hypothetical protein
MYQRFGAEMRMQYSRHADRASDCVVRGWFVLLARCCTDRLCATLEETDAVRDAGHPILP